MKEIITRGYKQITIKLDDEDYEKISKLQYPHIYCTNTNKDPNFLNIYCPNKRSFKAYMFNTKMGYQLQFKDGDIYNYQRNNVLILKPNERMKLSREIKKEIDDSTFVEDCFLDNFLP